MQTMPEVVEMSIIPVALPMCAPIVMARSTITEARNVFIRVQSVAGAVGWGEVTDASTTTGESSDQIAARLERFRSSFTFPVPLEEVRSRAVRELGHGPAALSGIAMALLDLEGRLRGQPVHALLGASEATSQRVMQVVGSQGPEVQVTDALEAAARGVRLIKLKVGSCDVEDDIAAYARVRQSLPTMVEVGADANGGMSLESALRFLSAPETQSLAFLEEPVSRAMLPELRRRIEPRGRHGSVLADESAGSAAEIANVAGDVDGVVLKVQKAGGLRGVAEALQLSVARALEVGLTGKIAESSLGGAALLHASSADRPVRWGASLTHTQLDVDPVVSPLTSRDGEWLPPEGPGLGVEVDEAVLATFRRR